jgi:hypothetical protein
MPRLLSVNVGLPRAVDYRPEPVEPPADGNLLICCSRPRGDIAIDL